MAALPPALYQHREKLRENLVSCLESLEKIPELATGDVKKQLTDLSNEVIATESTLELTNKVQYVPSAAGVQIW